MTSSRADAEIVDVPDPNGGIILELRSGGLRFATARATADMIHDMGIGRDAVRAELYKSLSDLRLQPELDRQVFGYWYSENEAIPEVPLGFPNGAVLPPLGATLRDPDLICLDLIPVQNFWLVLSDKGRYTYQHTTAMLHGQPARFVPVKEAIGRWPVEFLVNLEDSLPWERVRQTYGLEAETRARPDAPAVRLRLVRK